MRIPHRSGTIHDLVATLQTRFADRPEGWHGRHHLGVVLIVE
jgi:hypothetical protein